MAICHFYVRLSVVVLRESRGQGTDVAAGFRVAAIKQEHATAGCVAMHLECMTPNCGDKFGKYAVSKVRGSCPAI